VVYVGDNASLENFVHCGTWNEDDNGLAYELENLVVELLAEKAARERCERN